MTCPKCLGESRVLSTRTDSETLFKTRVHECVNKHRFKTVEVSESFFKRLKYQSSKLRTGSEYSKFIAERKLLKEAMMQDRLNGMSCVDLSKKYNMSADMCRYYTRIQKSKLYPKAKKWESTSDKKEHPENAKWLSCLMPLSSET